MWCGGGCDADVLGKCNSLMRMWMCMGGWVWALCAWALRRLSGIQALHHHHHHHRRRGRYGGGFEWAVTVSVFVFASVSVSVSVAVHPPFWERRTVRLSASRARQTPVTPTAQISATLAAVFAP
ncbi:GM24734 [Drosophila sechellia]|uniref:GM24734 n=1 Tax=Drosophila sechellia TaxID=7238 RepID=B4HEG8_DROSE|nr:GM24734 [Drosophila sechellia]